MSESPSIPTAEVPVGDAAPPVPVAEPATPVEATIAEPTASAEPEIDAAVAQERQRLREQIGRSPNLSRGMRDRLTALVDAAVPGQDNASGPVIRAADALALLEEAIPPQMRLAGHSVARQEHPGGEAFFTGDPNQLSDEQAEQIARGQLLRSGFARAA